MTGVLIKRSLDSGAFPREHLVKLKAEIRDHLQAQEGPGVLAKHQKPGGMEQIPPLASQGTDPVTPGS